jgi:hypothetical protein
LWQNYAHAAARHLNLQLEGYMATASGDFARRAKLGELLAVAEHQRAGARTAMRVHESSLHAADQGNHYRALMRGEYLGGPSASNALSVRKAHDPDPAPARKNPSDIE